MAYRSRTNWAAVILAVLFIGAAVFLGVVTEGFKNWDTSTWFNKEEDKTLSLVEGSGVADIDGNELDGATVHALPERMVFYSPSALSSTARDGISLKAVIEPADAFNQSVDWSVAWVETQSGTVTDYVTVTPDSDGSLTAKVKCLQPFDKKIKVVVTSRDKTDATAQCVLDFAQRITSIGIELRKNTDEVVTRSNGSLEVPMSWVADSSRYSYVVPVQSNASYSKHTITDNFTYSFKYCATSELITALNSAGFGTKTNATTPQDIPSNGISWDWGFSEFFMNDAGIIEYSAQPNGANNIARELQKLGNKVTVAKIDVTATGTYSSYSCSFSIVVEKSALILRVESISLVQDSVVL